MHETSVGPLKPAGVELEPSKMRFKIDVKPLAAGGFGVLGGLPHELTTDPAVLVAAAGLGVHQEPVIPSVPRDVDESNHQPILVPALIQTRLQALTLLHHPTLGVPPWDSTRLIISSSATGSRQEPGGPA